MRQAKAICRVPGVEHSTYGTYLKEAPNSFFWSSQWGHRKLPYMVTFCFARHWAKESILLESSATPVTPDINVKTAMVTAKKTLCLGDNG
jgi:hypothetical protein